MDLPNTFAAENLFDHLHYMRILSLWLFTQLKIVLHHLAIGRARVSRTTYLVLPLELLPRQKMSENIGGFRRVFRFLM